MQRKWVVAIGIPLLVAVIGAAGAIIAAFIGRPPNNMAATVTVTTTSNSTVESTLTTFCDALTHHDYLLAYDQLSSTTHTTFSYDRFVHEYSSNGGSGAYVTCTVSNPYQSGSTGSGTVTATFVDHSTHTYNYVLSFENGVWKLDSENQLSFSSGILGEKLTAHHEY